MIAVTVDGSLRVDATDLQVDTAIAPANCAAALAASGLYADYVVYECEGEWIFAGGVLGSVELDTEELRVHWDGEERRTGWTGRPAIALGHALESLPTATWNAYGWMGFESCAYSLGAEGHLVPGTPLAHLIVPRAEVRIGADGVTIRADDPDERDALWRTVQGAGDVFATVAEPVDVRRDHSDYRARVATAIDEICSGRYEKVILSRTVPVPFPVDMPATYAWGRANNTPARSFLLQLGGLQAAGFSPELVAAVDRDGEVVTEPLAGTRAFGRGADADDAARRDLVNDPKEIVEHAVSVRTSFEEIASVAEPGTSAVSDFMAVRERGSVQHLASTVRGRLAADSTRWDALDALFPSVTASGIPKRGCVDSIFRLDAEPRGLYSGAVLTVSSDGSLEATLVLRAVYQQDGRAWLRAGAGVIGQSNPEREFEETCEKLGSVAPYVVRA
ncbi:salicylate synthase [Speluncibacter jeojiensis]|uniref:Salicylate synthase n=1 Tax=Speluncibacter jeojiensis TaxID=2710754 RepID=A0A9X4LZT3_9ACTN|nr:salicylate synthase [Corynebacteriales bacterium D3-21]